MKCFEKDKLSVKIFENRDLMGADAAKDVANCIRALQKEKAEINMIFAAAPSQNDLLAHLCEEEAAYFRRGRNMGHSNVPKRATVSQYRAATGMEALFGYLHLAGREERIRALFAAAYPVEITPLT